MDKTLPSQFGKYLLIEKIAVGGMAEIFKAKVTGEGGFEKLLAIKRILPHLSGDAEFISMFMKEARLAALLSHPNIVQIYDFGNEEGLYYIAMEYLWGRDLKTILNKAGGKRPLPLECSLYVASKICAGLEYSHNLRDLSGNHLNIIHRDVNPQNILITHQGEVKIVDFGIAKIAEKDSGTKVGVLKGKASYMSPEQASGGSVDNRSDIFSTGALLYEMVTGHKAFQGETLEALKRVRNVEFRPPEILVPGLPSEVYEILHTALAKSPERRFQSCAEMLDRLESCLTIFSDRQSADNLSRHIRQILNEDFSPETRAQIEIQALASPSVTESDVSTTLIDHSLNQETSPGFSVEKARVGKAWLWAAGFCLSVAMAITFFSLKPLETPNESKAGAALAALQTGETTKALGLFESALEEQPDLAGELAGPYSVALLQEAAAVLPDEPAEGVRFLRKSIELNPNNPKSYFELGRAYTKLDQYSEAIEAYLEATKLDPNLSDAFFNLGFLYAKLGDYPNSEKMLLKSISLSPSYLDEAYFNLSVVQRRQGRSEESKRALEQAISINPENAKALEFLGKSKEGS